MNTALTINPKFRALIPPLAPEELTQLEANILADGCRDPLVTWNGTIIDGHNRYDICQKHGKRFEVLEKDFSAEADAEIWIIRNQFGRRNLSTFTRTELALKLEPLIAAKAKANLATSTGGKKPRPCQKSDKPDAIDTKKEVARAAGISHDTVAKVKFIQQNAPAEVQETLRKPDGPSINKVYKETKEKKQQTSRQEKRTEQAAKSVADGIIVGDFREHADKVADGSLSLIFTDPPYDIKSSALFDGLGEFAARKLSDGGSLLCYVGHVQLLEALASLSKHLRFWWPCACLHSGDKALMREYGIRVGWKPILWFVKGTRDDKTNVIFDTVTGDTEKVHHDWQQAQCEAAYFIKELCPPDGLVCDPFLGGGTTAAAAKALSRKWIGFEIDPATAAIASSRIE